MYVFDRDKIREMTPRERREQIQQRNDRTNRDRLGRAVMGNVRSDYWTRAEVVRALRTRGLPVDV